MFEFARVLTLVRHDASSPGRGTRAGEWPRSCESVFGEPQAASAAFNLFRIGSEPVALAMNMMLIA